MTDPLASSYYNASANTATAHPPLRGDHVADVCVVGGGFTGLAAALATAEAGYAVVLLEAERIGFGASGRNGGQLIPGLRWTMAEIEQEFGIDRAQAIFDVAYQAHIRVRSRIAKHAIRCDLKSGHLEAAYKPAHFDAMRRDADYLANRFGYMSPQIVQPRDMSMHIATDKYHGGVYDFAGGHFHPLNYTLGLADAARTAGVQIYEGSRVLTIDDRNGVTVRTASGTVRANHAVIACDSWTDTVAADLGRYTIPIMNYNIATAPLGDLADRLLPSDAAIADSRFVLNYFRLSADKRMIFGGGERYSTRPPTDIRAFVRQHMQSIFPDLAAVPIDYAWGGAVAVTANRLPHIGRRGCTFFAHGFSGHGALMTTLAGELIAEALHGTITRFDVLANLPHRKFPGGKILRQPLATLGLLWFALRDRL
jgi:gamma-glutamylputrescine oxidase